MIDASHKGPFPEERPLLCRNIDEDYDSYYLLNEDGSMDEYYWEGCANYEGTYDMEKEWPHIGDHLPLQKFLFKKSVEVSF